MGYGRRTRPEGRRCATKRATCAVSASKPQRRHAPRGRAHARSSFPLTGGRLGWGFSVCIATTRALHPHPSPPPARGREHISRYLAIHEPHRSDLPESLSTRLYEFGNASPPPSHAGEGWGVGIRACNCEADHLVNPDAYLLSYRCPSHGCFRLFARNLRLCLFAVQPGRT